jgi:hypothetical protein
MPTVWRAAKGAPVRVRAWYGNNGTGLLELYQRKVGTPFVRIGVNPGVDQKLSCDVAEVAKALLNLRTVAGSPSGADLPVFLEVSQNGAILPADDGAGAILNGDPPGALQLSPNAVNNAPSEYRFEVRFQ